MNYFKIYDDLIADAIQNPKPEEYKERHHIIPKCCGGDNSSKNMVHLTARQHYLAHWLLYKMYKTSSLVYAWHCMSRIGVGQTDRKLNSHLFEYCKKERKKHLSKQYKGTGNNFYGKQHSDATKQKLSEIHSGKVYKSEEQIKQWVESVAKNPKSIEHRNKIGRKGFMMLQNIHTNEVVRVLYSDDRCKSSEWVNPRKLKSEQKYKCAYCDMTTTASNLSRWHNEKCKRKPNYEN